MFANDAWRTKWAGQAASICVCCNNLLNLSQCIQVRAYLHVFYVLLLRVLDGMAVLVDGVSLPGQHCSTPGPLYTAAAPAMYDIGPHVICDDMEIKWYLLLASCVWNAKRKHIVWFADRPIGRLNVQDARGWGAYLGCCANWRPRAAATEFVLICYINCPNN